MVFSVTAWPAETELTIQTKKTTASVNPDMYGIFFEDINFGADGGLYAELIKNRSFEFPQSLMGWVTYGNVVVKNDGPFKRNPHYVTLFYPGHDQKYTGLENEGYRGIGYHKNAAYRFSTWARVNSGEQRIRVEFIDEQNNIMAHQTVTINSTDWKKYEVILTASQDVNKGRLRIFLETHGPLDLEHISLFPADTWNGRENGMRKDLVQALADLHPGVFRFPGGCIVEGTDLNTRYYWKNTIGPIENRPLNENRWHYTFPNRFFPDYYQSDGLGFFEYFQLCEDLGAQPLP
ncbi:MAG: carbohydrate binding domain-containing protein, partial [Bacteroidota bacterium]|nr:carbohydrate binding domain-containing protein [Bacteroidota bacterium]